MGSIKDYFRAKNFFITGGSGFLGKGLIEKLLRSCPDIGKIYVLVRPKKGKVLHERVEQILSSPLFSILKDKNPDALKKIVPINGDACKLGLGISESDRKLLEEEVHIFFNVAASVKFDSFLKDSVLSNLRSVRESALLALEMKKIEVFLHVSTAYCNIDNRKVVKEILYPPPGNWREIIALVENYDHLKLDILSEKIIGDFPNTYTYTKRLAEHCLNDLLVGNIPTVICRPTVVVSSVEEPFSGWTDNFNGPIGLGLAGACGILRSLYANPENDTDYTFVDNIVKSVIIAAWNKALVGKPAELTIYHFAKNDVIKFHLREFLDYGKRIIWDLPIEKRIWFPNSLFTTCWYHYYINVILCQIIPAVFFDLLLIIVGRRPEIFKIQRKLYIANMAVSLFILKQWTFDDKNALALARLVPPRDRAEFNCRVFPMSVKEYYFACTNYCRIHFLNESKEITEANKNRTRGMYVLDWLMKITFFILLLWYVIAINVPGRVWNAMCCYWESL